MSSLPPLFPFYSMATRSGIVEAPPHPTFTWDGSVWESMPPPPNNITLWDKPNISPIFIKSAQRLVKAAVSKANAIKGKREVFGIIILNSKNEYDFDSKFEGDRRLIKNAFTGFMDSSSHYAKVIKILSKKIQDLTPLAVIYARQNRKKRIRRGIMAGDEGYYPLNKFWDYNPNNPNEGAFLSEFQREIFKQDEILKGNLDII